MSRRPLQVTLVVAIVTIVADLGTKAWALAALEDGPVDLGWVMLKLAQNPGVAFSMGAGQPAWVVTGVVTAATVLIAWLAIRGVVEPPLSAGLLLGGGLGNLLDRIPDGTVTDMIDLGWFPSFNVADIALNVAIGLLLLYGLFGPDREAPSGDEAADAAVAADEDQPTG